MSKGKSAQAAAAQKAAQDGAARLSSQIFDTDPAESRRRIYEQQRNAERIARVQAQADTALARVAAVRAEQVAAEGAEQVADDEAQARAAMRRMIQSIF